LAEPILFYSNTEEYFWLDNFYRAFEYLPIQTGAKTDYRFLTNENFYQSQKAIRVEDALEIARQPTPYLAMRAGRELQADRMRPDWETIKPIVMRQGLNAKFRQNHDLTEKLIKTGKRQLCENSPTDLYWGMKGKNMLGTLLMEIRSQLQFDRKAGKI